MKRWMRRLLGGALAAFALLLALVGTFWGAYGVHTLFRNGGYYWLPVRTDSSLLSASMRLALAGEPAATPGAFSWQTVASGFEVADLPALVNGAPVDHLLLARIDPAYFRFVLSNASLGDRDVDQWMRKSDAALIVNGSYYSFHGTPATPLLSEGVLLGPGDYDAKAGAFVTSASFTGIRDLANENWQRAFHGATNAMVSYPLLVRDGATGVVHPSRWLANRSFVGQDSSGHILIGTTTDAFFSLDRLAKFLITAPLDLTTVLNLDGGPVACQAINLNGYRRETRGRWEVQVEGDRVQLLHWSWGTTAMPIVLAVFPK